MQTKILTQNVLFEFSDKLIRKVMLTVFSACDFYNVKKVGIFKRDDTFKDSIKFSEKYANSYYGAIFIDDKIDLVIDKIEEILNYNFALSGRRNPYKGVYFVDGQFLQEGIYENIDNCWLKIA